MKAIVELRKQAANAGINDTGQYIEWLETQVLELRGEVARLAEANTENLHGRTRAENALMEPRVGPLGL